MPMYQWNRIGAVILTVGIVVLAAAQADARNYYVSPSSPVVDQNGFFRNIFGVEFDVSCFSSVASGLVLGTDKFRRVVVTTFALALSETVDSI